MNCNEESSGCVLLDKLQVRSYEGIFAQQYSATFSPSSLLQDNLLRRYILAVKRSFCDRIVFTSKLWLLFLPRSYFYGSRMAGDIMRNFSDPMDVRSFTGSLINSKFFDQRKLNEE